MFELNSSLETVSEDDRVQILLNSGEGTDNIVSLHLPRAMDIKDQYKKLKQSKEIIAKRNPDSIISLAAPEFGFDLDGLIWLFYSSGTRDSKAKQRTYALETYLETDENFNYVNERYSDDIITLLTSATVYERLYSQVTRPDLR